MRSRRSSSSSASRSTASSASIRARTAAISSSGRSSSSSPARESSSSSNRSASSSGSSCTAARISSPSAVAAASTRSAICAGCRRTSFGCGTFSRTVGHVPRERLDAGPVEQARPLAREPLGVPARDDAPDDPARAHVDPDDAPPAFEAGELDVVGAAQARAVDVDQLPVENVLARGAPPAAGARTAAGRAGRS